MARATIPQSGIDWDALEGNYDLIRDKIEAVFPQLFKDYNARIRQPGGFHLYFGRAGADLEYAQRARPTSWLRRV